MAVESFQLQNGVRVAIDSSANLKSAAVIVTMRGGPAYEAVPGISHALEHGVFRGTKRLATDALTREVAATGVLDETRTLADRVELSIECGGPNRAEYAISLLSEVARWPALAHWEREREIVELEIINDELEASELAMRGLFADAPFTRPILGSTDDLARIDRAALESWHARVVCGSNVALAVAGPVDVRAIVGAAQVLFGSLAAGSALPPAPMPQQIRDRTIRVRDASTDLTEIAVGWEVPIASRAAAEALAFMLAGAETSALYRRLRTAQALCYEFSCDVHAYLNLGKAALVVEARARPGRAVDTVAEIVDAMGEIANGVSAADVDHFRDRVSLGAVHATPHDRAAALAESVFAPGGVRSFGQLVEAERAAVASDIVALAKQLRDAKPAVGVIGPAQGARSLVLARDLRRILATRTAACVGTSSSTAGG